jgi:hypothetical protein
MGDVMFAVNGLLTSLSLEALKESSDCNFRAELNHCGERGGRPPVFSQELRPLRQLRSLKSAQLDRASSVWCCVLGQAEHPFLFAMIQ